MLNILKMSNKMEVIEMGKVKDIQLLLNEYEENLHAYGHNDGLVKLLKIKLMGYGADIRDRVKLIDMEFDQYIVENQ